MDFLKDFGVQPVLLAAQAVNFLILLFILKRFLYRPLLKILEERRNKISQSLKDAEEIQQRLLKIEEDRGKKIKQAAVESKKIIEEATKTANQIVADAHVRAEKDIQRLTQRAQESYIAEREKLYQQIHRELADLVVSGLKAVAGKLLKEKDQVELIKQSLKEL